MGMFGGIEKGIANWIDGIDFYEGGAGRIGRDTPLSEVFSGSQSVVNNFDIIVYSGQARIFTPTGNNSRGTDLQDTKIDTGKIVNWTKIFETFSGKYSAGNSKIFLIQPHGTEIFGTIAISPLDESILNIDWNPDSYPSNTDIVTVCRPNSPGTFDAIIDPKTTKPDPTLLKVGTRYLIIDNIGGGIRDTLIAENYSNRIDTTIDYDSVIRTEVYVNNIAVNFETMKVAKKLVIRLITSAQIDDVITYELYLNSSGPSAWKGNDGSDFIANTNDIIEWSGSKWQIIFDNNASRDTLYYLTNIYSNVQYKWNGINWSKSFEGEYPKGYWYIKL
jgi:hypothetical protein